MSQVVLQIALATQKIPALDVIAASVNWNIFWDLLSTVFTDLLT